tara:strand:- start:6645 stop:7517 length:873 start_codon:yes stop_codon:yes gene_type:complete
MGTKGEVKAVKTFTLPNEIITVKFVPKKKGMAANVEDNHVLSGGMLTNATKRYYCPNKRSGGIANILTSEEKTFLEQELGGVNLSVYGDFWYEFSVSLRKDSASNKFDLSVPTEYISYKILSAYTEEIAPAWKSRHDKMTYMFAITRVGEEMNASKVKLDVKKEAFKVFGKIEDDKEKLFGALKLLTNQPISRASTLDWLQGKVQEHVDENPTGFLNIVKDPSFETKMLVNRAVELKVIKKNGNKHATVDGLDLCNVGETATFANTVRFLDNDKNQEVRLLIEARVETAK